MKTKTAFYTALTLAVISFSGCKKDKQLTPTPAQTVGATSLKSFYAQNEVKLEQFTFNASTGGTFTSVQGSKITVPANCFVDRHNNPVTGNLTIGFKDIFKKSDMLFSNISTNFFNGAPLKSGGEFFISISGQDSISLGAGKKVDVAQPLLGQAVDNNMVPMVIPPDSAAIAKLNGWAVNPVDTLAITPSGYVFSLYQFNAPYSAGTWCNSDNSTYFSSLTQTSFSILNYEAYVIDVFLIFKDVNSMVHVYGTAPNHNDYAYAPEGKECTVVAMGYDNNGKLHTSFTPTTITSNGSVTLTFSEMNEDDFKTAVKALD
ncbi:MAG TPA: hypothetical protein VNW06_09415 [Cytophagaceae bacterium]|nr:hypothetical protein [Cytophagaceae bacterium]